jgi:hypothetical protein
MPKMIFPKRDNVTQRLSGFPHKSFSKAVAHWNLRKGLNDPDAFRLNDEIKGQKAAVPIVDDKAASLREFVKNHAKVSGLLGSPDGRRIGRAAGDKHPL